MYKQEENLKQRRIFNSVEKSLDGVPKIRSLVVELKLEWYYIESTAPFL